MERIITRNGALNLAHERILEWRFAFGRGPADGTGIETATETRRALEILSHGSRRNGR